MTPVFRIYSNSWVSCYECSVQEWFPQSV